MVAVSVIVCANNPRPDYLQRTLAGLRAQSLPVDRWELLLIDNASVIALAQSHDVSWHPHGRHVREDRLGLVFARLHGIAEARAGLLVLVDDDLVLADDYLEAALGIADTYVHIGAFGCSLSGAFEVPVPPALLPYLGGLCVDELDRDHWSNEYGWSRAVPYGAGMCVRSEIAKRYSREVERTPWRQHLDRIGKGLGSGGDTDLAYTAIDAGYGTARFARLTAQHLISKNRLTEDYVVRLYAGFSYSNVILERGRKLETVPPVSPWRMFLNHWISVVAARGIDRRIRIASRRAAAAAWRVPIVEH